MQSKIRLNKPIVLILFGYPGAGKTSFARQFCDEFGLVHLQEDKLTQEFFGNSTMDERLQQKAMHYLAGELLRCGVGVVFDSSKSAKARSRKTINTLAKDNKAVPLVVWFQIDPETAFGRLQNRDRRKADDKYASSYTEEAFKQALNSQQNPVVSEDCIVVSGKHTFNSQKNAVLKKLFDLNIIKADQAKQGVVKPGLMNLVPHRNDFSRRNITIR